MRKQTTGKIWGSGVEPRDALKKQLAQPGTYQELGFEERLSLLTAEELTYRENRKAERLIKHARFRLNAELSKLDYCNNRTHLDICPG